MIAKSAFNAVTQRATNLLISRGFASVPPENSRFLTRYIPLDLVGMKGDYEALCVKVRRAQEVVSPEYVESFCRIDICQFRSLLILSPGDIFLRCEEWVASPNGSIHCFEVMPDAIREVAAYAR